MSTPLRREANLAGASNRGIRQRDWRAGITVSGGTLDLNGFNQTVPALALLSSSSTGRPTVTTGAGTLTLGGNVTMDGGGGTTGVGGGPGGQISGKLNLGGRNVIKYNAAVLFGVTSAAPDHTLRAQVEYEF